MNSKRTLRQVSVALLLLVAFLFQGTWALAGVTGGLRGVVQDDKGAPVAGAAVKVTSASQIASATTDSSGRFAFLSLAPDTYTVSIDKSGFNPVSEAGVTVFADQQQTLTFRMQPALKTIAKVTSTSAGSLVKSGVGGDIYNVTSSQITASSSLGGGGNLNSAYSAIASVPGVNVPVGGSGWNNNAVFIRGSQSYFTGFEYDGIPVNRAFDNYNSSTESNLGLQELQVYTGGGPASNSSSGTSGFINQVIKTGTYPGYLSLAGGIASSAFYHQAKVEAGGASPDRRFSYYVGLSGYNQALRAIDNANGAGLMGAGGIYSDYSLAHSPYQNFLGSGTPITGGAVPMCDQTTGATPASALAEQNFAASAAGVANTFGDCLVPYFGLSAFPAFIADRENVVNFHFAIPRANGQRDDLQLLWSGSMLKTWYYGDVNDLGGINNYMLAQTGLPYIAPGNGTQPTSPLNINSLYTGLPQGQGCQTTALNQYLFGGPAAGACNYAYYNDAYVFNQPFGTSVSGVTPSLYQSPDSPTGRSPYTALPYNQQDAIYNDTGIVKAQYTHSFGERAFARLAAYTFYSDWDQTGPYAQSGGYIFGYPAQALAANYILSTHTTGGELQFTDEINDKNLLQFTANYTEANVLRDNNSGFVNGTFGRTTPTGLISGNATTGYTCYDPSDATIGGVYNAPGEPIPCYRTVSGAYANIFSAQQVAAGAYTVPAAPPVGSSAAAAGAKYVTLWDGPSKGAYNTVKPKFTNMSLTDQWRPSDRWLFNLGLRYESYIYDLPNSTTTADQFYASITKNYSCYNPGSGAVLLAPLSATNPPPATPQYVNGDCNAGIDKLYGLAPGTTKGWAHPNGVASTDGTTAPVFSAQSPSSYNLNYWSLRVSGTYTQSPDTVWRFSAGRFIEPPISASTQYLDQSGNFSTNWAGFMSLGFFSPFHPVPAQTSGQYDVSLERHVRGTDLSFKVTPFYNLTNGYQEQSFIGPGFVTQIPVGQFRSYGAELGITKGDFAKNGFSGSFALTYTDAKTRYQKIIAHNQIDSVNAMIQNFNALTKGGATDGTGRVGSLCYPASTGKSTYAGGYTPASGTCNAGDILNPYYTMGSQGTLDPNGWYAPASNVTLPGYVTNFGFYDSPWVSTLILNWRKDKLAITPSFQFVTGSSYGSPFDVQGLDPTVCGANQATSNTAIGAAAPAASVANMCDWTTLQQGGAAGGNTYGVLYIPNPQTGSFTSIGQYHNPNLLTGNIAFTYDMSPKISLNLTLSNIFHTCFGGSKTPWSSAYAPGSNVCGYGANGLYVSNFQKGVGGLTPGNTSAYDAAANGTTVYNWQQQSYAPTTGSGAAALPQPFNAYLTVNIKI